MFLKGDPGTGKTEIAKALAAAPGRDLIRLQCYEGLDAASALYDRKYDQKFSARMIAIRRAEASGKTGRKALQSELFGEEFLIEVSRPLAQGHASPANRRAGVVD